MSHSVELDHVTMRFGDVAAVRDVNLEIRAGEFFSVLGPSGCGKTTILRLVCGFAEPTAGSIRIGGRDMRGIGANRRPTAMIFQNLALFPLMTVAENIAFGLEVRGVPRAERRRRAEELLALIALPGYGEKMVSQLSGGQRQRVAIARALAVEPQVLLLDEPLSALDLKLRQHMRAELRAIQKRTGVTFIYITHDQGEALTMSDRIAVMSGGVVQQVAAPEDIYERPSTPFVASFVGETNCFAGHVVAVEGDEARLDTPLGPLVGRNLARVAVGDRASIFIRPERLVLDAAGLSARVSHRNFEGSFVHLVAEGPRGEPITVQLTNTGDLPPLKPGETIGLAFRPDHAVVLKETGAARG
ncbi:ABC transporter ATP-binding protein [Chelatococcus sp. GCM10030263]|uniref:ABC transporter ATP-binding protein n=1 Tax=Chelatococcus sp. GCM10030263 TaxID=3273387 RepID=UPI003622FE10